MGRWITVDDHPVFLDHPRVAGPKKTPKKYASLTDQLLDELKDDTPRSRKPKHFASDVDKLLWELRD